MNIGQAADVFATYIRRLSALDAESRAELNQAVAAFEKLESDMDVMIMMYDDLNGLISTYRAGNAAKVPLP